MLRSRACLSSRLIARAPRVALHRYPLSRPRVLAGWKAPQIQAALRAPLCTTSGGGSSKQPEVKDAAAAVPPLNLSPEAKLQLSILLGSGFVIQMAVGMIIPVLPHFAESVGLGSSGVGLIVGLPAVAKLLLNLPVGHLVD